MESRLLSPTALSHCSNPAASCWDSLCCQQPVHAPVYGCFKRAGRDYAQCRPRYGWNNHTEVLSGVCTDSTMWHCLCTGMQSSGLNCY